MEAKAALEISITCPLLGHLGANDDCVERQPAIQGLLDRAGHSYGEGVDCDVNPAKLFVGEDKSLGGDRFVGSTPTHDPIDIPQLRSLLTSGDYERSQEHQFSSVKLDKAGRDPLSALPLEVLFDILVQLDSSDVASLRRASRMFAHAGLLGKF
ncbi:Fc.00g048320.m01.CDS01 [Cosmosporella sp. VM-42]